MVQWFNYFQTTVYRDDKPEFLDLWSACNEHLAPYAVDRLHPVRQSASLLDDPRFGPLSSYMAQTAWDILNSQGYAMAELSTYFTEMWAQEHWHGSDMAYHTHGNGTQIVGFYFLEAPEGSSSVVFHDPKPAKVQTCLPEADPRIVTPGSNAVYFKPEPGLMLFSNAWLPHSFTRNASNDRILCLHANISVQRAARPLLLEDVEIV